MAVYIFELKVKCSNFASKSFVPFMKQLLYFVFSAFCILFCLSCDKMGGVDTTLEGTYSLLKVEGKYHEFYSKGDGDKEHGTFVVDYKNKSITLDEYIEDYDGFNHDHSSVTSSWASGMHDGFRDFLDTYVFFPIAYRFDKNGTVIISVELYDPEVVDLWGDDRLTVSGHYYIRGGILEIVGFIGGPNTYKFNKSGSGFTLEPTEELMTSLNNGFARDTRESFSSFVTHKFMEWTKATYQKQ